MGVAVSQATRSTLQILCWMCSFSSSWDVDYSVPRSAKVQFTRINGKYLFYYDNMQLSVVGAECEGAGLYKSVFRYKFHGIIVIYG